MVTSLGVIFKINSKKGIESEKNAYQYSFLTYMVMSLSSTDWQSAIIFLLNSDCLEMWFKKHHKNKQAEKPQQNKNKLS